MDLTGAKSVLQRVAEQYKAAKDLGDALEVLVSLEQQQGMLSNNVEHLLKEQADQQASLEAMKQEVEAQGAQARAVHNAKVAELSRQRETMVAQMQAEKEAAAKTLTEQMAAANQAIANEKDRLDSLTQKRQQLESYIADLEQQAEEIKSKMRQFVS